ncbi:MAG: HAMP domain-containing histidine kinase [Proteobacteria bacterium]|nr:HAMP domain-containing histidine kinase [Pseudomonadota bacterium]
MAALADSDAIFRRLMEIARTSALEELASGIAHEINQPLGAMATFSHAGERMLDRETPLVARALEVFRQISHEALKAGDGIHRIRRMFDAGDSARARCQMPDLVAELLPVLQMMAARYQVKLQWQAAPDLPPLILDRLRIQHVLFALVQNAFEAISPDHRHPGVKILVEGDRYSVQTSVIDSGCGVTPEHQLQLFRPFFTTKRGGTGLGLSSCRAIVESHEGTIGFESPPAGGSRFWFRLPAAANKT